MRVCDHVSDMITEMFPVWDNLGQWLKINIRPAKLNIISPERMVSPYDGGNKYISLWMLSY